MGKGEVLHLKKDSGQKDRRGGRLFWATLALSVGLMSLHAAPQEDAPVRSVSPSPAAGDIVQPYEINDLRFCEITPAPFTCQRCLQADEQFVRILRYGEDGSLYRIYACRPFRRPYLE